MGYSSIDAVVADCSDYVDAELRRNNQYKNVSEGIIDTHTSRWLVAKLAGQLKQERVVNSLYSQLSSSEISAADNMGNDWDNNPFDMDDRDIYNKYNIILSYVLYSMFKIYEV